MNADELQYGAVWRAAFPKFPELKRNIPTDQEFPFRERLQPAAKFGQVLFLYRLSNVKGGRGEVNGNNSRVIAVIE